MSHHNILWTDSYGGLAATVRNCPWGKADQTGAALDRHVAPFAAAFIRTVVALGTEGYGQLPGQAMALE